MTYEDGLKYWEAVAFFYYCGSIALLVAAFTVPAFAAIDFARACRE